MINNIYYLVRFLIGLLDFNNLINEEAAECLQYTIDNIPYGSVMLLQYYKELRL